MRPRVLLRILAPALLLGLSHPVVSRQSRIPTQSQVILEATNIIHGVGHYVGKTLLVRLRKDGTVEWEKDLDARKREGHVARLSPEDVKSIRERLNAIDQSSLVGSMGPYATYVDTFVELKIHLANKEQPRDLILTNPWPSGFSMPNEKPMPRPAKELLCEITQLRTQVSGETLPATCKDQPSHSK